MRRFIKLSLSVIILSLLLAGCGKSIESNIEGNWKVMIDGDVSSYLEIGEERFINRTDPDDIMTIEYTLTKTQENNFILEFYNPEAGMNEFMLEGYFDNKDKIIVVDHPGDREVESELIRVDNIQEDMKKEEKRQAGIEKEETEKEETEIEKQEKKQSKKTADNKEELDIPNEINKIGKLIENGKLQEAAEKKDKLSNKLGNLNTTEYNSSLRALHDQLIDAKYGSEVSDTKSDFFQEAENLDDKISKEHNGDVAIGAYGDYFDQWDAMLNDVWDVLKETLPTNKFEELKQDQHAWIQEKDEYYEQADDSDISAKDVLTKTTRDRTYDLIEEYME